MPNKTFIVSMVLSVACVSAANATVVYGTIDPFTDSPAVTVTHLSLGQTSGLTGTLWESRTVRTSTSGTNRAKTSITIGSGSMVFGVEQQGSPNTASQRAIITYDSETLFPEFLNFTSLEFDFVSTLDGILSYTITHSTAYGASPVQGTISGSGRKSLSYDDFGGWGEDSALGTLSIQFDRTGSNASGLLTITNLVANGAYTVPAPGAIALLGAAGLVGARRRRA